MTAVLDAPAPPPNPEQHEQARVWVRGLCETNIALALAASDLPRTTPERDAALGCRPRHMTPAAIATVDAWVMQGTERAGGPVTLWEAAGAWRAMNMQPWSEARAKRFFAPFGGRRRADHGNAMAYFLPTEFDPVTLQVPVNPDSERVVRRLEGLYYPAGPHSASTAAFRVRRHDAHMAAAWSGHRLQARDAGTYTLT